MNVFEMVLYKIWNEKKKDTKTKYALRLAEISPLHFNPSLRHVFSYMLTCFCFNSYLLNMVGWKEIWSSDMETSVIR
jgi:hypothetical protein